MAGGERAMNPDNFFAELKRRDVCKVAVASEIVDLFCRQALSNISITPSASVLLIVQFCIIKKQ